MYGLQSQYKTVLGADPNRLEPEKSGKDPMKDPFEAACDDHHQSPPESPLPPESPINPSAADDDNEDEPNPLPPHPAAAAAAAEHLPPSSSTPSSAAGEERTSMKGKEKAKEEENMEEEEEEENMVVPSSGRAARPDPDKMTKMQAILSQFTGEQMTRYESFRRSGFQKSNMKRLLTNITGSQKISIPMTIVVSGIAKMFVGELIETGKTVMMERKESGPVRPCHIREAYRRLKLEGKIPKRSVPRRFR